MVLYSVRANISEHGRDGFDVPNMRGTVSLGMLNVPANLTHTDTETDLVPGQRVRTGKLPENFELCNRMDKYCGLAKW